MADPDPLAALERLTIAEEVAAVARHELGNRLGAIRNAVLFIRRTLSANELLQDEPRIDEFLALIDSEAKSASNALPERLSLAQFLAPSVRRVSPADCIRAAARLARPSNEPGALEVSADPAVVECDPYQLTLALRCLLENAVEARALGPVAVRGSAKGAKYLIEPDDRGPGIAPELWSRALQPFFTTKPGQAGLGLGIAQRAVRRCGGDLGRETSPSGGRLKIVLQRLEETCLPESWAP